MKMFHVFAEDAFRPAVSISLKVGGCAPSVRAVSHYQSAHADGASVSHPFSLEHRLAEITVVQTVKHP